MYKRQCQAQDLYEPLDAGRRYDQKTVLPMGRVPVLQQQAAGYIGFHNDEPGVRASEEDPVVTFANHTCEMRLMTSPFSAIQNVFSMRGIRGVCTSRFLYYGTKGRIRLSEYKGHHPDYRRMWIGLPPLAEQRAIAAVLGALDDKVEANAVTRSTLRCLGLALFQRAVENSSTEVAIGDAAASVIRGVAPKYTDPGSGELVLNQKCIRDGWASPEAARWMQQIPSADARKARRHDVVVNSTGVGTLGRAARWIATDPIAVDGHVTVVRPDAARCPPVILGYALLAAQSQLEVLGEGSTGQTELSRKRLAEFQVHLPGGAEAERVAGALEDLDDQAESLRNETHGLIRFRDVLLPPLLSGELRIRDAESLVCEAI